MGENIGDSIMFSLLLGMMVTIFITAGPEIEIVRTVIVPITAGFCTGKLVYGVWKETS